MSYQPERGWGFSHKPGEPTSPEEATAELEALKRRLSEIEAKLEPKLETELGTKRGTKVGTGAH